MVFPQLFELINYGSHKSFLRLWLLWFTVTIHTIAIIITIVTTCGIYAANEIIFNANIGLITPPPGR